MLADHMGNTGLRILASSFSIVPKGGVCIQRQLLRYHARLVRIQTGMKNRIHTILAKNNITQSFSDLFGKQGKELLRPPSTP
ncbi:MAG: hypothetical protein DRI01_05390 [Chloroflexi bacterium]|nr:MAG: hypothetical protein DRI01_05390 [Chloroflexota bacterium]